MKHSNLIVQKYGGSSLATPEQVRSIAKKIAEYYKSGHQLIIVVSAMGKTTDQLIDLAYQISPNPNRRELDMLVSTGERISMALMSMSIHDQQVDAISLTGSQSGVLTDDSHSNARILDMKPMRVESELNKNKVVIVAGFQGVSPQTKEITTLGRGGSDTTAVALAAYFKASCCEIRKDVSGLYSADPNVVSTAKQIPRVHYKQMLEMSFYGAKLLHYRSVELAYLLNVPLHILLAHGEGESTIIDGESKMFEQAEVLSVNSLKDVRKIQVHASELAQAFLMFDYILKQNHLSQPQILDTEKTSQGYELLISAPKEQLQSLQRALNENKEIEYLPNEYSLIAATCRGSFASDLPQKISQKLKEKNIKIHKMLFSAMTLSCLIDQSNLESSLKTF